MRLKEIILNFFGIESKIKDDAAKNISEEHPEALSVSEYLLPTISLEEEPIEL